MTRTRAGERRPDGSPEAALRSPSDRDTTVIVAEFLVARALESSSTEQDIVLVLGATIDAWRRGSQPFDQAGLALECSSVAERLPQVLDEFKARVASSP